GRRPVEEAGNHRMRDACGLQCGQCPPLAELVEGDDEGGKQQPGKRVGFGGHGHEASDSLLLLRAGGGWEGVIPAMGEQIKSHPTPTLPCTQGRVYGKRRTTVEGGSEPAAILTRPFHVAHAAAAQL